MGMIFENLIEEEMCDLMCGDPEEELDFVQPHVKKDGYFLVRWNKCSEKLPMKNGFYLTSTQDDKLAIMEYSKISESRSFWLNNGIICNHVKWMDVPQNND